MIVLPCEFDFAEIGPISKFCQLRKGQILTLPDAIETIVFTVSMELYPVVALVPSHPVSLEIIQEVYRSEGMLAETNDTKSFVDNCHGDRRPPGHHCFK